MILDGLQVTLLITAGAVVLGTFLGSRTFDAFLPIIVTAIIYFFMAWLIGRLLKSLVEKRYLQTLAAAAGLLIGATVCYVPEMFSSPVKSDEVTDVPAVFQALAGKDVGVVIGSIHDLFSKDKFGDMQAFVKRLKDMGSEQVEFIPTDGGRFMSPWEAKWMGLSGSALLVGRK